MFYYDLILHRNTLEANKLVSKNLGECSTFDVF